MTSCGSVNGGAPELRRSVLGCDGINVGFGLFMTLVNLFVCV